MMWIAALAGSAILAYGSMLGFLFVRQRSLMYFPRHEAIAPADAGLAQAETIFLATRDGETLLAWFVAARESRPLLLYFHGNASLLADMAGRFAALTAQGEGLLAIQYRGYGGSSGTPTEAGLHCDADAAYAEALARGYRGERIIVIGESLGTGVAVALAARAKVAGVVLEAAFTSTVAVGAAMYWMFPVRSMMADTFRSDLRIAQVRAPMLFLHGTADQVVPIRFGEGLFALAREPKQFLRIEGGGHQILALPETIAQVSAWIVALGATVVATSTEQR